MARIAELPLAGPITGDETLPVVQGGTTKRTSIAAFLGDTAAIAIAAVTAEVNDARDDAQEARDQAIPAAANAVAARDSALIYKTNAETAQAAAATSASDADADRVAAASARTAAEAARDAAISAAAGVGPVTAATQAQMFDLAGSVNLNGTGTPLPNNDYHVAIGPRNVAGLEPLFGADPVSVGKSVAIGPYAMQYFDGYDSLGIGWRAAYYATGRNTVAIGVHSGEATGYDARSVPGFGVRASGSITFTGLPSDGDTITLNGTTFTARDAAASAAEFTIGGTVSATIDNLLAKIVGSTAAGLRGFLFRKSTSGTVLEILAFGAGTWANAFTLAVSGGALARSAATLAGGTTLTNDGNQDSYTGMVAIGVSAVKRFDMHFARAAHGVIFVTGQASVGASITLGIGNTVSAAAATPKRFVCVAAGAAGLQFNQGADAAAQAVNIVSAFQAYVAANPTHTQMTGSTFYVSQRGVEIVYNTAGTAGNFYRTETTGAGISAQSPFLHGGFAAGNVPPIGIGTNQEAGMGGNFVMLGSGAGRVAQGRDCQFLGAGSGLGQIGVNNVYWNSSGQNVIGSNNFLFGPTLGGATVQTYVPIAEVSPTGLITLVSPLTDPQCEIGRRMTFYQRNLVLGSNIIKRDGANLTNPGMYCIITSPKTLQIIDFTDGSGPTGNAVFSTSGPATDIEVAPFYATLNFATSWGDAPESSTFHIGQQRQDRATVRASRLEVPFGRWQVAALTAAAAHAVGNIQFATASGNFVADDTVTVNGVVFTAKAAATFATPNTSMIRWFRIGADMHESLQNLIACIRNSDDDTANARLYRIATFWISAQTGSGWRLNWRVTGRLVTGNNFTMATSKAGATVTASSGGTAGTLPLAATVGNPGVIDGERRQITLGGQPVDAIYSAALDDYQCRYWGSA